MARGTLSVASLHRVAGGKASSALGAPATVEDGEITFLGDHCGLVYTGSGESTDRVINLAGKRSTVTLDQSGSGLLKFTGDLLISGYGHDKTMILTGSTAGRGEIAAAIANPYDRAAKARMALTKTGTGTWTLSGANSYTGPTTVAGGMLSLSGPRSLSPNTGVHVAKGAMLGLNFKGRMRIGSLTLDGKRQPAGAYGVANAPAFIKGSGILSVQPAERR